MTGRAISHYQILEKLGEGGMGVVYKARDMHLDRFVAIKVLSAEKVADPERKLRFVQEAKAASALSHPNIIHVYDIDQVEGTDFISMEYVAGKTLDRLIPRPGMRLNEALKCAVQIAGALARAHAAGIIHRDLKPGNIMVDEHGLVKVLDFGLAKLTETLPAGEDDATRTLKPVTEEGKIVGTVAYMSPEQAEGKRVDARSDIFSFGSVLYEMVTGRRAFQGDTRASTLAAILKEEPRPASQLVEGLPKELERLISRCLRKDVDHRFQHMDDVKIALEELKEESDSGALNAAHPPKVARHRRLMWVAGLVMLLAAAVGAWFVRSISGTRQTRLEVLPLTSDPGGEAWPSLSPDGSQVVFVGVSDDLTDAHLYVKLIGGEAPKRLTNSPDWDYSPAWSPDGKWIAFLRGPGPAKHRPGDKATVLRIPAFGGAERELAQVSAPTEIDLRGPCLAWLPDGEGLVVTDQSAPNEPFGVFLFSFRTREKHRLTTPPASYLGDDSPAIRPDGRALAFTRTTNGVVGHLYLLELTGDHMPKGEARQLTFVNQFTASPVWTADGRDIVFSSGPFHRSSLWRVAASGSGRPERLSFAGEDIVYPAICHRAQRLVYERLSQRDPDIWRVPISVPGGKGGAREKLIQSTRVDHTPQYSPDGRRIAFGSNRSGNHEIWVCDSDGSNPAQVTSFGGAYTILPHWSPDSTRIVFESDPNGHRDVYAIQPPGGAPQRLTIDPSEDGEPCWSRDGRWIFFSSDRTGTCQIWRIPSGGGAAVQVTHHGGNFPLQGPDGTLYYLKVPMPSGSASTSSLWKLRAAGGEESMVLDSVFAISYAVVDQGIYFIPRPFGAPIQFFNFTTQRITNVVEIGRPAWGFAVSPDGRTILYAQHRNSELDGDLMLVENFR